MKKSLLILIAAVLAALAGALPAGAATAIGVGGGGPGGGRAAGSVAAAPGTGTGPLADEVALGSFVSPTRAAAGRHGAADDLKAAPGCAIQCITSGIAYGRGPDARLVVTTDSPAQVTIVVSRDGYVRQITSAPGATTFAADFDDLQADTHYDAFVSAVDGAGQIANRSGSFTTLRRNVDVTFFEAHVSSSPHGNVFGMRTWFEGDLVNDVVGGLVAGADGVIALGVQQAGADDTGRHLDLDVELSQVDEEWGGFFDECEVFDHAAGPSVGSFQCEAWAYATFSGGSLDLDDRPSDATGWNHYTIDTALVPPAGNGGLPGAYGTDLHFSVPVGVVVTWTS